MYDRGHCDVLRAEALTDAHLPAGAHDGSCGRRLRYDARFRHYRTVEVIVDAHLQANGSRFTPGIGLAHTAKVRDLHFGAVNGEVHGGERRDHGNHHQQHQHQRELEEAKDHASAYSMVKVIFAVFSSIAETEQYFSFESRTASSMLLWFTVPATR